MPTGVFHKMLVSFFNINHHALALSDVSLRQCQAGYTSVLASREYIWPTLLHQLDKISIH